MVDAVVEGPSGTPAAKRAQSTVQFPYNDLEDAVAVARTIWSPYAGECDIAQLAGALGQKTSSGAFRTKVLAAKSFGLLQGSQRLVLTPLGRQIVSERTERAARAEAFLNVPLFRQVFETLATTGGILPEGSQAIETLIGRLGVVQNQRENARQTFMRSAKQAGYLEHGNDRLVRPAVAQLPSEVSSVDHGLTPPNPGKNGGVQDHPLMVGLLQSLPELGKPFRQKDRERWLRAVEVNFDFIYGPVDEIKDTFTTTEKVSVDKTEAPSSDT